MRKICFFISSISLSGGTERVCAEIANRLSALGYEISVLSMYGDRPFFSLVPEINTQSVFKNKRRFKLILPYVMLRIRTKLNQLNPDIVVSVDAAMFCYAFVCSMGMNKKHLVWEHFNFNVSLDVEVRVVARKLAARYSNTIVTLTQKDRDNWRANLKCRAAVITIPNPSPFAPTLSDPMERKGVVLSVGRLTAQKGFDRLIQVWSTIKSLYNTDWILRIIGSGELEEELSQLIEDLGLCSSVELLPATPDIAKHYQEASIYCMTSRFEGFPMVLLEAQSFGLPLISYNCETGPSEIINGKNGFLIRDNDSGALAESLMLLITDKELRQKMGEKAADNARKYDGNIIIEDWVHLLEKL